MYTQEEYEQLKHNYLDSWTDEELQTRKEEIIHLINQVPHVTRQPVIGKYGVTGYTTERNPQYALLNCQYHDLDEEQDVRAYYAENPSPTRAEFNAQRP